MRILLLSLLWGFGALGFALADPAFAAEPQGQVWGSHGAGKLFNPSHLPAVGKGFVHLFGVRDRGWGSEGLVQTIESVAEQMADLFPMGERLQIGDLSQYEGGPISGHGSHQNGLDADLAYFRKNHKEQPDVESLGFTENFVINGKLTRNFDLVRNWTLFKVLVATGRINRIFVGEVIKNSMCRFARQQGDFDVETLRSLRPWPNHDDHIHLRLTCPVESPDCIPQDPIEPGSGCPARYTLE